MYKFEKTGFKKFIRRAFASQVFCETPAGDFIDDAFHDLDFLSFKTKEQLVIYLENMGATGDAIEAGKVVFDIWKATHGQISHGGFGRRG